MVGRKLGLLAAVGATVLLGGIQTGSAAGPAPDPPPPSWTGFIRRLVGETTCTIVVLQEPCLCSSDFLLPGAANPPAYLDRSVEVTGGREPIECLPLRTDGITVVPPECPGEPEPLTVHGSSATWLEWPYVPCSPRFDGVRGDVAALRQTAVGVDLGTVLCLFDDRRATDTSTLPDTQAPLPGQAFFFLVRNADGFPEAMTYGRSSLGRERHASAGDCVPDYPLRAGGPAAPSPRRLACAEGPELPTDAELRLRGPAERLASSGEAAPYGDRPASRSPARPRTPKPAQRPSPASRPEGEPIGRCRPPGMTGYSRATPAGPA